MRILLVEDDEALALAVATVLTEQQYVIDIAADGQAGWEFVGVTSYDLIVLDVMLPKLDGISLCRQLRREGYQMPILLLTAKDTGTDKVIGLDAGADDYVVKPFDFQELTARIRALLRRGNSTLPPVLEWGSLRLDPSSCEVTYKNYFLHLTPKEYALLELFLRNTQRVFSKSAIIDHLWTFDDPPEEDTIKSHIKGLRQKLKVAGAPTDFIETVYGLGYRLSPSRFRQLTAGASSRRSRPTHCLLYAGEPVHRTGSPLAHEQSEIPNQPKSLLTEADSSQAQQQVMLAVAKAREDFKTKIGDRLSVLEQAIKALQQGKLGDELRLKAEQEAHKLAGALGTFGFAEGSQLAQEIEQMLQAKTSVDRA